MGDPGDQFRRWENAADYFLTALIIAAGMVFFLMAVSIIRARAQEPLQGYHSNPSLLTWIPSTCCVTNDCCWEIQGTEVRLLPPSEWPQILSPGSFGEMGAEWYEIRSTGQKVQRKGFSPDGKFYRCACDYDAESKTWNRHQGANTRCLFVPQPNM